jgi:hypothetical protein
VVKGDEGRASLRHVCAYGVLEANVGQGSAFGFIPSSPIAPAPRSLSLGFRFSKPFTFSSRLKNRHETRAGWRADSSRTGQPQRKRSGLLLSFHLGSYSRMTCVSASFAVRVMKATTL